MAHTQRKRGYEDKGKDCSRPQTRMLAVTGTWKRKGTFSPKEPLREQFPTDRLNQPNDTNKGFLGLRVWQNKFPPF